MAYDEQYGTLTFDPNNVQDFIKFKDTTDHSEYVEVPTCIYRLPCGICRLLNSQCLKDAEKIEITC